MSSCIVVTVIPQALVVISKLCFRMGFVLVLLVFQLFNSQLQTLAPLSRFGLRFFFFNSFPSLFVSSHKSSRLT